MAPSNLTFDQAVEMILGWYHHMRVDHLLQDEFLFEIDMRSIVIRDDPSFSRRKRSLREHLKVEKEDKRILDVRLSVEKVEDIGLCERKYEEISLILGQRDLNSKERCKNRLLHLSHRLLQMVRNCDETIELADRLRNLFVKCVQLLRDSFYSHPSEQAEGETEERDLLLNDLFAIKPAPPQLGGMQIDRDNVGNLDNARTDNATDQALVLVLQARIRRLEDELALYMRASSVGGKVDCQNLAVTSDAGGNHAVSDHASQFKTNLISNSQAPTLANPFPPQLSAINQPLRTSSAPKFFQSPPQPFQAWQTPVTQNLAQLGNNFSASNANAWPAGNNVNSLTVSNPVRASFNPGQSAHRTLPVSRWTLTKYDGEDQGLKLNEFLEVVQALSLAEHVSEDELFQSAVHLFTGHALKWYMTMRTAGRLINWPHLVLELRRTFMHPDLNALIKMKIYQRRQQCNESFTEFYFEMECLFRTVCNQIPDHEKMQILLQNMRIDYKKQLTFLPMNDLDTLVAAGQKVDALNFSAFNKVFGMEKQTNAITVSEPSLETIKSEQRNNHNHDHDVWPALHLKPG